MIADRYEILCAKLFGRWIPNEQLEIFHHRRRFYIVRENYYYRWN